MKSSQKTIFEWVLLGLMAIVLLQTARVAKGDKTITFNRFIEGVKKNQIENVTYKSHGKIEGRFNAVAPEPEKGQIFETKIGRAHV